MKSTRIKIDDQLYKQVARPIYTFVNCQCSSEVFDHKVVDINFNQVILQLYDQVRRSKYYFR